MVEELADLVRRRGSAKAALTRLEGSLGAMIDIKNETISVVDLNIRLEHLEKIFTSFSELDEDIQAHGSSSELNDFERRYFEVKGKLRNTIQRLTDRIAQDQLNFSIGKLTEHQKDLVGELHNTSFNHKFRDDVRLPKINIPPFSGDFSQFPTFKDLYEVSIHNIAMSDVHKFKYLRGLLTGEAASLITNIPITSTNYKDAWEKICNRYDNVTHISTTLLDKFFAQPHSKGDPRKLRTLSDVTDEIIRALKALGENAEKRDVWLIYMLLERCDDKTRQTWALETYDVTFPTIDRFLKFLTNRSFALERSKPTRSEPVSSSKLNR